MNYIHRDWEKMTEKSIIFFKFTAISVGRDSLVGIATELWAGRSGDRIPMVARFSATVQTGLGAKAASYTMDPWY